MSKERLLKVLLRPHMSEKSINRAEKNRQFVFEVVVDATKTEIKQAVEMLFKVEVSSVRALNIRGKRKHFGRRMGKRPDWKKAYVTLKPGHDISFADFQG
jgi:large subunit ribosomal protein L23